MIKVFRAAIKVLIIFINYLDIKHQAYKAEKQSKQKDKSKESL